MSSSGRYSRTPHCSLYVRNVPYSTRADELREMFSKYGSVSDVYIPMDYYTREPRGFAYVQFDDSRDAEDAMHYLQHARFGGRELEIEHAKGDRKKPQEMRYGAGGPRYHDSRRGGRSRSRSPRRRSRSPRRRRSRSGSAGGRRRRTPSPPPRGRGRSGSPPPARRSVSPPPKQRRSRTPASPGRASNARNRSPPARSASPRD